ncbi:MAG: M20 family metallo-hydrolase [Spirochaetaceae bacterium]|jgi:succinyl-diaminopimelate desuccinylase|nr:M20 family metallo-hydrolase [Spirochaetaceae bacterium]
MAKETIFGFIEKNAPLVIELETELTKRPAVSPESGGEGEVEKCRFLEGWLKDRGITALERLDAPDGQAKGGVRPNLIATIPGKTDAKRLWIMSHLDVVPPGEASLWKSDPWQVIQQEGPRGTILIGRGVEDNQQGLCSSVLAALSLTAQGIIPPHPVKLLFAADEEMGSTYGIDWLLKNHSGLFRKDDMILIPDGGDSRGETIEIAEKNLLWVRFTTTGAQAHGSRPDQGINAHLAGAALAVRLHDGLSAQFPDRDSLFEPDYSTFQPTKKEANVPNINTIPGEDVFYMDMRILPRYPIRDVLKEIDRIKGEVEGKYRVKIAYTLFQSVESRPTSPDAPLVKLLSGAVREVYGVETRPIGIGGGTVGAYLRNAGLDSVVWGRMDDTAHQPNEYAVLENILGDAKVMALLMMEER